MHKNTIKKKAARFHGHGTCGHSKRNYEYNNSNSLIIQAKAKNDCISVLNHFGIEVSPGKNILCPIHEETNPSCSVYADGEKTKCFSCGASGDCIDWYVMLSGKDKMTAIKELARNKLESRKILDRSASKIITQRRTPPGASTQALDLKTDLKRFIVDYSEMTHEEILSDLAKLSTSKPASADNYNPILEAKDFIKTLYDPEDFLFIGDIFDAKKRNHVMQRNSWIKAFEIYGVRHPFLCLNPVSHEGKINADNKLSFRNGQNITQHKYSLFENDTEDLRDQAAFWHKMILKGFPVRALTFSGNKSLHAVVETKPEEIEGLKAIFIKLGFDRRTFDPARQSRLPGYWRDDKQKFQKLLFLRGKK